MEEAGFVEFEVTGTATSGFRETPAMKVGLLNGVRDSIAEHPSWEQIEAEIRRLDGDHWNYLSLHREDKDDWLAIGGGAGRYLLFVQVMDAGSYFLINVEQRDSELSGDLMVCDQEDEWPERYIVGLDEVIRASTWFAEIGTMDPGMEWELWELGG